MGCKDCGNLAAEQPAKVPSETKLPPVNETSALTDAPELVCEMSNVPPAPGVKVTLAEFAIDPLPFSASVAPSSIWVALV